MNAATPNLPQRRIGSWQVSAVGLGCLPLSNPEMQTHREQGIATIHRALDVGITLFDTANIYAPRWDSVGHNEELLAQAFSLYTGDADISRVLVATKGGITRSEGEVWGRDSTTAGLKNACEASMTALGVTAIDLYQHHRHDPSQTYENQMKALASLRDDGWVRQVGLSNATLAELEVALEVLGGPDDGGVVSVQNEFSPRFREGRDVLDRCTDLGIAFLPWSPLGGVARAKELDSTSAEFAAVAAEVNATPQEVALAWLMALSPVVIPIPGASKPVTVDSIVRATTLELSSSHMTRLNATDSPSESTFPEDEPRSPLR